MKSKKLLLLGSLFVLLNLMVQAPEVTQAAETKIGVMNVQKVLAASNAGKQIKAKIEAKMKTLREEFRIKEEGLIKLQQEIEKKSSVWTKEVKAEKLRDFKRMQRELKEKNEDANLEMRQLQNKELEPVIKKLDAVVKGFGEKNGYTIILDEVRSGVLFLDTSIIVTEQITEELNKAK